MIAESLISYELTPDMHRRRRYCGRAIRRHLSYGGSLSQKQKSLRDKKIYTLSYQDS